MLGTAVGGGAIAVMALFGLTHPAPGGPAFGISADSGRETKMPGYSSPVVPAMTTSAAMSMGATTTTQPTDEPTALATPVASPTVKPGS
ncbi:hypothetical protein BayCH28_07990 [Mycolicibacterium sp. CH28]|uniref:hypothetical protein n=1 Tax=Mycolicibacterium sp. CH28 TaxID=2512237 RepID=UPI0010816D20|nr:hypothetical protein [Mycolicibacterium sp. CH28]TGD89280.1 hypothetical protein BayCH28_07990 [Mycolicibacterium sp. CH28]